MPKWDIYHISWGELVTGHPVNRLADHLSRLNFYISRKVIFCMACRMKPRLHTVSVRYATWPLGYRD